MAIDVKTKKKDDGSKSGKVTEVASGLGIPQIEQKFADLFYDMSVGAESTEGVTHVEFLDIINAWYQEFIEINKTVDWADTANNPPGHKEMLKNYFAWSLFKAVGKRTEHQPVRDHVRSMFPDRLPKEFIWEAYGERLNFEDAKKKYELSTLTEDKGNKEALIDEARHLARLEMNYDYAMDHKEDPDAFPLFNQRIEDYIESLIGEWEFEFTSSVFDMQLDKQQKELEEETIPEVHKFPVYDDDVAENEFEYIQTGTDESYFYSTNPNIKDYYRNKFYEKNPVYDMQGATMKKILAALVKAGGMADIMFDVDMLTDAFKSDPSKGIVTTDHGTYLSRLANKTTDFWDYNTAKNRVLAFIKKYRPAFDEKKAQLIDTEGSTVGGVLKLAVQNKEPSTGGVLSQNEMILSKGMNLPWMINFIASTTASKSRLIDKGKVMNEEVSFLYDYVIDRYPNLYKKYMTTNNPEEKDQLGAEIAHALFEQLEDKRGDWYGSGKFFNKTELTDTAKNYLSSPTDTKDTNTVDSGNGMKVMSEKQTLELANWMSENEKAVGPSDWETGPMSNFIASGGTFYYNKDLGMGSYKRPKGYADPNRKGNPWVKGLGGQIVGAG
tara:strand:+ start:230 stop:2056 length:1827 start_codon:yes stop_codon:yes gene_type:complete